MTEVHVENFVQVLDDLGVQSNASLLVAVSGGVDSTVLLWLLASARKLRRYKIGVVHIDHMLRDGASDKDRQLVESMARFYHTEFFCYRRPIKRMAKIKKQSLELVARDVRYSVFNALLVSEGFDYVILGHHKQDLAESVLLHLIRGCGIDGLVGMHPIRGKLIRPLLGIDKSKLYALADANGIMYREDATNQEVFYTRNKIRHQMLPALKTINPSIENALLRLASLSTVDSDYLNGQATLLFDTIYNQTSGRLQRRKYFIEHEALRKRILKLVFASQGIHTNLSHAQLAILDDWLCQTLPQGVQIFHGIEFRCQGDHVIVNRHVQHVDAAGICADIDIGLGETLIPLLGLSVMASQTPTDNFTLVIEKASFLNGLKLRTRRSGDYIRLKGLNGHTKSLKKFFNESKVDLKKRQKLPLLVVNHEVIWVKGLRASIYVSADGIKHPVFIEIKEI